jgi:hypothetical protein
VAELLSGVFESAEGEPLVGTQQGEPCIVRIEVRFHQDVENPIFAVNLRNDRGETAFATSTQLQGASTGSFRSGETASVRVRFDNWLAPGRYNLEASVTPDGLGANAYDLREQMSTIIVYANRPGGGAADLPHDFEIERT